MRPKVSIIIPTYNRAHYLPEALESALSQTYPNLEILVVNDGSTDNTEQVLAPYMSRIRYIKRENGGCSLAKNTALQYAIGELLTNLDDDDRMHPQRIERQVERFEAQPRLGICGTGVNFINAEGQFIEHYTPPRFSKANQVLQLLRRCFLIQSSVLIHRKCHERLGGYKLTSAQDYDFWLRVALHYEIGVIEEMLTDYRYHDAQITSLHNRPKVKAAVGKIIQDFLNRVPLQKIIPGICCDSYGHAAVGLALCEQGLFDLAEIHLNHALPNPAGHFCIGLLKMHAKQFSEAKTYLEWVKNSDSPFASQVSDALRLMERAQAITQNRTYTDASPEVVQLRKDLSRFRESIIQQLLAFARSGDGSRTLKGVKGDIPASLMSFRDFKLFHFPPSSAESTHQEEIR